MGEGGKEEGRDPHPGATGRAEHLTPDAGRWRPTAVHASPALTAREKDAEHCSGHVGLPWGRREGAGPYSNGRLWWPGSQGGRDGLM